MKVNGITKARAPLSTGRFPEPPPDLGSVGSLTNFRLLGNARSRAVRAMETGRVGACSRRDRAASRGANKRPGNEHVRRAFPPSLPPRTTVITCRPAKRHDSELFGNASAIL
ncbi:unnamed protein product, partial [Iphiclides podalirius]